MSSSTIQLVLVKSSSKYEQQKVSQKVTPVATLCCGTCGGKIQPWLELGQVCTACQNIFFIYTFRDFPSLTALRDSLRTGAGQTRCCKWSWLPILTYENIGENILHNNLQPVKTSSGCWICQAML